MKNLIMCLCALLLANQLRGACVQTETGVKLEKKGKTVWNFVIENPDQKPYIHPVTLPDGLCATDIRPNDHIWHLGLWFCWKYLNGVNYWEPADRSVKGSLPAGMNRVAGKKIALDGDAAEVELEIEYRPRGGKRPAPVMREKRTVSFSAPDAKGGYTITSRHRFTAVRKVTIGRTPPHMGKDGIWSGYAGLSMRMSPGLNRFRKISSCGETSQIPIIEKERKWIGFVHPRTGHGFRLEVLKGTPNTRFYNWKDNRFFNPSPVYAGPVTLQAGETWELAYRLTVY